MATSYPAVQETQLGAPVADYRGSVVRRVILSVIGVVLVLMGVGLAVMVSSSANASGEASGSITGVVVGLLFLAPAVYCFITLFTWRGARAQLFQQGFIISRAGKTTSARWEDVASITQQLTQMRYYGLPIWTSHQYDLTLANGETARVNNGFSQPGQLGSSMQQMAANATLPRAIAAYQSGATQTFGKFSVSHAGISNGKETLPWNEVKSVLFSNGFVFVMKEGKMLRWAAARIAKTPNIYVLSALVSYIKRGGQ